MSTCLDWFIQRLLLQGLKTYKKFEVSSYGNFMLDNAPTHPENIPCEEEPGIRCVPHVTQASFCQWTKETLNVRRDDTVRN